VTIHKLMWMMLVRFFRELAGNLNVFDQDSEESRASASYRLVQTERRQRNGERRFLTHFKPWLFAVIKVSELIVGTNSR